MRLLSNNVKKGIKNFSDSYNVSYNVLVHKVEQQIINRSGPYNPFYVDVSISRFRFGAFLVKSNDYWDFMR